MSKHTNKLLSWCHEVYLYIIYSLDTHFLYMYFWLSTGVGCHLSDIWIILAKIQQNATRCLCLKTNVQLQLESCNMLLMTDMFSPFRMYQTYLLVQDFSQLRKLVQDFSRQRYRNKHVFSIYATIGYTFRISHTQNWTKTRWRRP